jgi:FMN phosphatase YigB (HAD superfamily)
MIEEITSTVKGFLLSRYVEIIVWDFDGTIFRSAEIATQYEDEYFKYSKSKSKDHRLTLDQFRSLTNTHGSWARAASVIAKQKPLFIANHVDSRIKKIKFVRPDDSIVKLITGLGGQRHFILSNSRKKDIVVALNKIGFSKVKNNIPPFEKILSRDDGINKPNLRAFKKIIKITNMPPKKHLMIGDSLREDIYPARNLGFFTMHINEALQILPKWVRK